MPFYHERKAVSLVARGRFSCSERPFLANRDMSLSDPKVTSAHGSCYGLEVFFILSLN